MPDVTRRPASTDETRLKQMIALRDEIVAKPPTPRSAVAPKATERPISFNEEMVRALLAGRKTQTRRLAGAQRPAGPCKFGVPGDLLWVRERWAPNPRGGADGHAFIYSADADRSTRVAWKQSYHMPREACRIVLEITDVRVERVTDIREADARAEGFDGAAEQLWKDARGWFHQLWNRINSEPGTRWSDDPWVWVIHFKLKRSRRAPSRVTARPV
jgi:hypothetical protein